MSDERTQDDAPTQAETELTESDLEAVAGGASMNASMASCSCSSIEGSCSCSRS